jgi:hypothetical protein
LHQLTADWTADPVVWRAIPGELSDHHRFLDAERAAILIDTFGTKIHWVTRSRRQAGPQRLPSPVLDYGNSIADPIGDNLLYNHVT